MTFGERLALLRKQHGWTLRQTREAIERETGHAVALSYIGNLEKDRLSPTLQTVTRIAAAFGMTAQQFLDPVDLDERRKTVDPYRATRELERWLGVSE